MGVGTLVAVKKENEEEPQLKFDVLVRRISESNR